MRSVPNGYTLWLACQANDGPQEDNKYNIYPTVPSRTWDFGWDPDIGRFVWVYDWWMNTPPQRAAYDWYSWPDPARHCNFTAPPPESPPPPTSVRAVPTSSGNIHVTWQDNSGGSASYIVRNGTITSATQPPGSTSYDWAVTPGARMCFTVAAERSGLRSPWSTQACARTPATPWCPTTDATHPTCTSVGAFQMNCKYLQCSKPTPDYMSETPNAGDLAYATEAAAAYDSFWVARLTNAQKFFGHYEDNTGTDLDFDATVPYHDSTGTSLSFSSVVNNTVKYWVRLVNGGAKTFDSGYLDYPPLTGTTTPAPTRPCLLGSITISRSDWNNCDWQLAVGHGFYRVTGDRQANGTWQVHLQLTSYYQFREGAPDVLFVNPTHMHRLEIIGWAEDYREIGTGTLAFSASGNPVT